MPPAIVMLSALCIADHIPGFYNAFKALLCLRIVRILIRMKPTRKPTIRALDGKMIICAPNFEHFVIIDLSHGSAATSEQISEAQNIAEYPLVAIFSQRAMAQPKNSERMLGTECLSHPPRPHAFKTRTQNRARSGAVIPQPLPWPRGSNDRAACSPFGTPPPRVLFLRHRTPRSAALRASSGRTLRRRLQPL